VGDKHYQSIESSGKKREVKVEAELQTCPETGEEGPPEKQDQYKGEGSSLGFQGAHRCGQERNGKYCGRAGCGEYGTCWVRMTAEPLGKSVDAEAHPKATARHIFVRALVRVVGLVSTRAVHTTKATQSTTKAGSQSWLYLANTSYHPRPLIFATSRTSFYWFPL